jgi:hypothetical protein
MDSCTPNAIQYSKFYGDQFTVVWKTQPNSMEQAVFIEPASFSIDIPPLSPMMPMLSPILPTPVTEYQPLAKNMPDLGPVKKQDQENQQAPPIQRRQIASIFHSIAALAQSSRLPPVSTKPATPKRPFTQHNNRAHPYMVNVACNYGSRKGMRTAAS